MLERTCKHEKHNHQSLPDVLRHGGKDQRDMVSYAVLRETILR